MKTKIYLAYLIKFSDVAWASLSRSRSKLKSFRPLKHITNHEWKYVWISEYDIFSFSSVLKNLNKTLILSPILPDHKNVHPSAIVWESIIIWKHIAYQQFRPYSN